MGYKLGLILALLVVGWILEVAKIAALWRGAF